MVENILDIPVLESLSAKMRCGIFTNKQGEILIVHDQKLSGIVDYIEYEIADNKFYLIYEDGKIKI